MREGSHHSPETIEKIRMKSTGRKMSDETKLKMSLSKRGSKHPLWGKRHSEYTRNLMSESQSKSWRSGNRKKRSRKNKTEQIKILQEV